MKLSFLPDKIKSAFKHCRVDELYEIRLRVGYKIKVLVNGSFLYLTEKGYSVLSVNALICEKKDIDDIIRTVTEYSVYAHNDKLKCGYLSYGDGIRIGVAGECVYDDGKIITVKNVTSLNIRIPHEIIGCSDKFFDKICNEKRIYNTLIISPPLLGKTTLLKDIARQLDKANLGNILIIDERGEFSVVKGENIDTISFSEKIYAFEFGLRSMSPKIVITDELVSNKDWDCVYYAGKSGVSIIASCHGFSLEDILNKDFFRKGVFERYVLLKRDRIGELDKIYDEDYNLI